MTAIHSKLSAARESCCKKGGKMCPPFCGASVTKFIRAQSSSVPRVVHRKVRSYQNPSVSIPESRSRAPIQQRVHIKWRRRRKLRLWLPHGDLLTNNVNDLQAILNADTREPRAVLMIVK